MDGNCKIKVRCCFCNSGIESTDLDPCGVDILTNWDKPKNKQHDQTFWCHLKCFRDRLHSAVAHNLLVDLLIDDE
jgi:hypothetical protein